MTYDIYRYIFIIAGILCGVMFVISILLFILLKVPKLISDLSGATARKAIKNIREQNETSGEKHHKVSPVNEARGKLTDKISESGKVVKRDSVRLGFNTAKIATQNLTETSSETTVLGNETTVIAAETSVLSSDTTVLDAGTTVLSNETTVLDSGVQTQQISADFVSLNDTENLNSEAGCTTNLKVDNANVNNTDNSVQTAAASIYIEYDITYIHTSEVIEGVV